MERNRTRLDIYGLRGENTFKRELSTSKLRLKSKKHFILNLSFKIALVTFMLTGSIGQLEIL